MITSNKQSRPKPDRPKPIRRTIGIVDQVRVALSREHRLATAIGALIGTVVPVSTFALLHGEIGSVLEIRDWSDLDMRLLIVVGGLAYSALTVYRWGSLAFGSPAKALGFTVLLEGIMTLSRQPWLSAIALGYLCLINAVATGVTLARGAERVEGRDVPEPIALPVPALVATPPAPAPAAPDNPPRARRAPRKRAARDTAPEAHEEASPDAPSARDPEVATLDATNGVSESSPDAWSS